MVNNDQGLLDLKQRIIEAVSRLAWEDMLTDDELAKIPYIVSPGPLPAYRCCVYKEREIVRERVRLALGKDTIEHPGSTNIVQTIRAACDQCPISTYSVSDNCRFCLGKACLNSCNFKAITPGEIRMHIDPTKCKSCGMCAKACPYGAILHLERPCKKVCPTGALSYDEFGCAVIDESKCINCGQCIHTCPFGAISSKVFTVPIIQAIKSGKKVIGMCAPSIEGQFGSDINLASIRNAMKKVGFYDMIEVGLGADMTAAYESKEWYEALEEGRKVTTSCCPGFTAFLKKHYPKIYEENMSQTISPMCAVSRYLKAMYPDCVTVFVGPCISKKAEAADESIKGNADYVLTFNELYAMMHAKDVKFEPAAEDDVYQEASLFGKKFASAGGVAAAVIECMQERGQDTSKIKLAQCSGGAECKKTLTLLLAGKLDADFIEGMACNGGCISGPSQNNKAKNLLKARKELLDKADDRRILENLKGYDMEKISMFRDGSPSGSPE